MSTGDGKKGGRKVRYSRGWEPGVIENKFHNIVQFFAIEKVHRGGNTPLFPPAISPGLNNFRGVLDGQSTPIIADVLGTAIWCLY